MHIAGRTIAATPDLATRPFVIAELGVNHDGRVDRALDLVRAAARAGADAVKFQVFEAERLMSRASRLAAYQRAAGESDPVEMLRRLELSFDDLRACVDLAHTLGLAAIATVFSLELVPPAHELAWDAFKTASPDIIHKPLLHALSKTGRPLIVSTGASTPDEIQRAVQWLTPAHDRLAILQCVSSYPTPMEHAELDGILALRAMFDLPVGYSDHTQGIDAACEATRRGACILEKHFTHDTNAKGPDHAASLVEADLARYVARAREGAKVAATTPRSPSPGATKRVLPIEQDVRTVSRQSIVAARSIKAGTPIRRADLTFKRPGTGLPPFELQSVLGQIATRDIEGDTLLNQDDLAQRRAIAS
ncbi:MAG: N-acetylneuraminate synthase family protein [Phycisphaerales bacterium]